MRIGQLAKRTGVTTRALRFYEEEGLLTSRRLANGYRDYDEIAVTRVTNIRYLLDAGLTLEDVHAFQVCLDGDMANARIGSAVAEVARRRLAVLDKRIADLVAVRDHLANQLFMAGPKVRTSHRAPAKQ
ncbi:MerR family transcriptional regulator [Actinosynnema sp. ALI-1.44]|uniref:MerR family transcriptional regulator n=1 Tax=Actinosynnema sp. ALI-1.44 TaxID=1933779 RepID=UPI00097C3DC3|nr:MerR family transcriptional regulator [Actinosynnema sp. ALI-1.44]ONI72689.1 MerR family transcriptional regulator [Actinosynnema sp. ALI-1.44]